jgi:restriction system protein
MEDPVVAFEAIIKGFTGELRTRLAQHLFLDERYHSFNNIIIPSGSVTTQIDHVIVSIFGIFVIETKNRDGWIFGNEREPEWTQDIFGKKYRFQNPLHQNYRHTASLAEYLQVDPGKIQSVIVFWGNCQFKTKMPDNVLCNSCTGYIKSKKEIVLSDGEVAAICEKLGQAKDDMGILSGWLHSRAVKKRFESTKECPKCGGRLVERKGRQSRQKFLGCSNYPICKYTKEI